MIRLLSLSILASISLLVFSACGGGSSLSIPGAGSDPALLVAGQPKPVLPDLPADRLQPWEAGHAVTGVSAAAELQAGVERFNDDASATEAGAALRVASVADGLGWALYRIPLASEPGVVSIDANLHEHGGGAPGEYWVALGDYGRGAWDWHGPYTDAQVTLSTAGLAKTGADFTSELGNVFVLIAVYDGSSVDIVAVGVEAEDGADTSAPDAPGGLTALPVAGGLSLQWNNVIAGDLAGYRVHWSFTPFTNAADSGVQTIDNIQGRPEYVLPVAPRQTTYVAVSAVDRSGNASALSSLVSALPGAGTAASIIVSVDNTSVLRGAAAQVTASGAASYAWDLDGDGVYDVTGDTAGVQQVDTGKPGIIRPVARGTGGGELTALGSVSLFVTSNSRPVAVAQATPSSGTAPLTVDFAGTDSTDFDGTVVGGGWDFDGDGIYDVWDDASLTQVNAASQEYTTPGLYNAKLRVVDDQGAWDVDTVTIIVTENVPVIHPPVAELSLSPGYGQVGDSFLLDSTASDDDGSIVNFEWDFDGDGTFDAYGASPKLSHIYHDAGVFTAKVRVTDDAGAMDTATATVRVNEVFDLVHPWGRFGHDPRSTGRSPYIGAQSADVKWSYATNDAINGSPAIGADGTVYIASTDNKLYALNSDGSLQWSFTAGGFGGYGAPAIGQDGAVYVCGLDDYMYCLNPDGSLRWSYLTGDFLYGSPALAADGTVYFGSADGSLYALNPDGSLKWTYATGDSIQATPAIAADGTIYIGSDDFKLHAVNPDGSQQWAFTTGSSITSAPAIGPDGTVYVGSIDDILYAINPDGSEQWSYPTAGDIVSSPAIAADGTVYVGSLDGKLHAVNPDGSFQWAYLTGDEVYSSPAIGADGTVYFGSYDNQLYAIIPDGTELWSYTTGNDVSASPAIGADGTVYAGSADSKLYAFGQNTGNTAPTADLAVDQDRPLTNQTVTFDATGSSDSDGSVVLYEWDFDGDGAWDASGSAATATHSYGVQSGYEAVVRVTDNQGAKDTATVQLAATHGPWTGFGHDTLNSGRSPYVGAQTNSLKWSYTAGDIITNTAAIGGDGTIYFGSNDNNFYALNPDGSLKWSYTAGNVIQSAPAIAVDGTVFVASADHKLYALHPDGSLKWTYVLGNQSNSSPAIGADGTIYLGSIDHKLYAINPDGTLQWTYTTGDWISGSSPAIATDGTIYIGSWDNSLYALNPDGSLKWSYTAGEEIASSAAIGPDGTVYFGSFDNKIYALNPDGTLDWSYSTSGNIYGSPAVGADGTIYCGSADKSLYALNPDGSLAWDFATDDTIYGQPTIGADGNVYFGDLDFRIYCLDSDGNFNWFYDTGGFISTSSPAIGADGTVYVGSWDNKLYAIGP